MSELKQYRDPWMFENTIKENIVGFYPREFYVFDNFSAFAIEFEGPHYPTVEHAYQSLSFKGADDRLADEIIHAKSAHDAQKIAYANKDKRRSDWDVIKLNVMEKLLRAKIEQHPYVKKKLLDTFDYAIVEDSPKDDYWGCGIHRDGANHLGKLWVKLRTEIKLSEGHKRIQNND